jgi:hypothetical protein
MRRKVADEEKAAMNACLGAVSAACAVALAASPPTQAHHSVAANFDMARRIEVTGEVVEWRFRNPHSFLVVEGTAVIDGVASDAGVQRWEIESSASASMRAMGIDETTFFPGLKVTVSGAPHRNSSLHRINAFANRGAFLGETGDPIGDGAFIEGPAVAAAAPSGVGAARLAGLWRPPFQPNGPTTPLALTEAGRAAWEAYDQKLSPANSCEVMSIPDLFNAPSYVVTLEIGQDRAVVSNQAYNVVRAVPLDGTEAAADPAGVLGVVSGRIEGEGLVIESRGYPPSLWGLGAATQIMGAGADVPSSAEKTVVERFSVSEDGVTLIYEYTVDDPVYLSEPFSHRVEMARLPDDTVFYPYDCDVESASQFSRD